MKQALFDRQKHRAIWQIAWPLMLSNISVPLLGLVDTAVLGHLNFAWYMGAAAVGGNIFTFVFWAFGFLRMATTGLTAQSYGAKDWPRSLGVLTQGCLAALLISVLIIAAQTGLFPIAIGLIGGTEEVRAASLVYCQYRVWGAPATLLQFVLAGWLIGTQQAKTLMAILLFVNAVNIVLDVLLVMVFELDIRGVALATVLSEYLGLGLSFWFVKKYIAVSGEGFELKQMSFTPLRAFFQVNGDIFIRTCLLIFVFAFFTAQGAKQGDETLAANAVLITFLMLIANSLDGFANAAEAKAGEYVGQYRSRGARVLADFHGSNLVAGLWSAIFSLALLGAFGLFGAALIDALTDLPAVAHVAKEYLPWLVWMPLITFLSFLFDGIFIGTTKTKEMRDVMFICLFMVFFPTWYFTQNWGNHGLWFSLSMFMLARSILMGYRYFSISSRNIWFA
ncbi:MAG: MATE family efflux transporter [Pseudomonadales bacterium]|nr:MATE family efflux transporter [Pseudomonadales bacterium]